MRMSEENMKYALHCSPELLMVSLPNKNGHTWPQLNKTY